MGTAAIFIDLENFYRPARDEIDEVFALTLMRDIGKWTNALRRYDKTGRGSLREERSFIIQNCYSGERIWSEIDENAEGKKEFEDIDFRKNFRESNYEIIFCPELTGSGKNASDIAVAVDALSLIHRYEEVDEVFILAGDADYHPLIKEIRRLGPEVFILKFPATISKKYFDQIQWFGGKFLDANDFYLMLEALKLHNTPLTTAEINFLNEFRLILQPAANARQGFLPFYEVITLLQDNHYLYSRREIWNKYGSLNQFFEHVGDKCSEWMRVDSEYQGLRIPNKDLNIDRWGVFDEGFTEFVRDALVAIDDPIPFYSPKTFEVIFECISQGIKNKESPAAIASLIVARCTILHADTGEGGLGVELVDLEDARTLASTIKNRLPLRASKGGNALAKMSQSKCAEVWRMEIFRLARRSDFMATDVGIKYLCTWFSVLGEDKDLAAKNLKKRMTQH